MLGNSLHGLFVGARVPGQAPDVRGGQAPAGPIVVDELRRTFGIAEGELDGPTPPLLVSAEARLKAEALRAKMTTRVNRQASSSSPASSLPLLLDGENVNVGDSPPLPDAARAATAKASPRGGDYHRRITRPDGKHVYVDDEEAYARRPDAHVDGHVARRQYVAHHAERQAHAAGAPGLALQDLKPLADRHGVDIVVDAIRSSPALRIRDGRLFHHEHLLVDRDASAPNGREANAGQVAPREEAAQRSAPKGRPTDAAQPAATRKSLSLPSTSSVVIPVPLVKQEEEYGCYAAAIQAVLKTYLDRDIPQAAILTACGATKTGGTPSSAAAAYLRGRGLDAKYEAELSDAELQSVLQSGGLVILWVRLYSKNGHLVLLHGAEGPSDAAPHGRFLIMETGLGEDYWIPAEFLLAARWGAGHPGGGVVVRHTREADFMRSADLLRGGLRTGSGIMTSARLADAAASARALPVGTRRQWGGRFVEKQADGTWKPVSRSDKQARPATSDERARGGPKGAADSDAGKQLVDTARAKTTAAAPAKTEEKLEVEFGRLLNSPALIAPDQV